MERSMGVVALAALLAGPALADQARTRFIVSAVVPKRVTLTVLEQPAQLLLSSEDIERGYKEVSARYRVQHNDPHGYLLHLAPRIGLTRRIEVRGLATEVRLDDADLAIRQTSAGNRHDFELAFRFVLDPEARPGSYALPVHVTAAPF
jgi:hypothetical protein